MSLTAALALLALADVTPRAAMNSAQDALVGFNVPGPYRIQQLGQIWGPGRARLGFSFQFTDARHRAISGSSDRTGKVTSLVITVNRGAPAKLTTVSEAEANRFRSWLERYRGDAQVATPAFQRYQNGGLTVFYALKPKGFPFLPNQARYGFGFQMDKACGFMAMSRDLDIPSLGSTGPRRPESEVRAAVDRFWRDYRIKNKIPATVPYRLVGVPQLGWMMVAPREPARLAWQYIATYNYTPPGSEFSARIRFHGFTIQIDALTATPLTPSPPM